VEYQRDRAPAEVRRAHRFPTRRANRARSDDGERIPIVRADPPLPWRRRDAAAIMILALASAPAAATCGHPEPVPAFPVLVCLPLGLPFGRRARRTAVRHALRLPVGQPAEPVAKRAGFRRVRPANSYPVHAVVISTAKSRRDSTAVQSRQSLSGGAIVAV